MSRTEQGATKDALVLRACARFSGRFDLHGIIDKTAEQLQIFVIHPMHFVDTEIADAPTAKSSATAATWPTTAAAAKPSASASARTGA